MNFLSEPAEVIVDRIVTHTRIQTRTFFLRGDGSVWQTRIAAVSDNEAEKMSGLWNMRPIKCYLLLIDPVLCKWKTVGQGIASSRAERLSRGDLQPLKDNICLCKSSQVPMMRRIALVFGHEGMWRKG